MNGQLLNNKQINDLVNQHIIKIKPYRVSKLQISQYPLIPKTIWEIGADNELIKVFQFDLDHKSFHLKPNKYYLIDVLEQVILPLGIVGRFIPSSNIIEKGILLTTGKIEFPYGQQKEKIRFGLYNSLNKEVILENNTRLAYIQLFDIRGLESLKYKQSNYDINVYSKRISIDSDGPNYELDYEDD